MLIAEIDAEKALKIAVAEHKDPFTELRNLKDPDNIAKLITTVSPEHAQLPDLSPLEPKIRPSPPVYRSSG